MLKFWVFSCCVFLTLPVWGQGRDTVLAVHKLFRQQRPKGYEVVTAGAAPFVNDIGDRTSSALAGKLAVAAVSSGLSAGVGTLQAHRYSPEREALILQQYAQGIPIPADVRRRLNRRHFRRTAADISNGY